MAGYELKGERRGDVADEGVYERATRVAQRYVVSY
jgi:hypothetical protein